MEITELGERLARLEEKVDLKFTATTEKTESLRQVDKDLRNNFTLLLKEHADEEREVLNTILSKLNAIEEDRVKFKGTIGGFMFALTCIVVFLQQIITYLHIDLVKLIAASVSK